MKVRILKVNDKTETACWLLPTKDCWSQWSNVSQKRKILINSGYNFLSWASVTEDNVDYIIETWILVESNSL